MTRLGAKLPFREAAEEVWFSYHTRVAEATLRRVTHRHGAAAEALVRQEVEALERDALEATARPGRLPNHLSYFSRSYPVRDFERYALAELHRRGLENAAKVAIRWSCSGG
jgi:hypothetical protein